MESVSTSVAALADHAQSVTWRPEALPWDGAVDWEAVAVPDGASLLASSPLLQKMSPEQRRRAKQREMASHLGALTDGEKRAVGLAAETVLLTPDDEPEQRWFLGTLLADESKHQLVLRRFLDEKLHWTVHPYAVLDRLFAELTRERDFALNLLAGQVVLEGAAAALLNGLLVGVKQPLLREILRNIGRDEARHIRFAHTVVSSATKDLDDVRRRRMEEILFEAAYASVASLVAEDAWDDLGLDRRAARQSTVDVLRDRGVISFFTRVVVRQLGLRGFPADELGATLSRHLEARLRSSL